jgi:tungstate transport system substrate-binding protein
VNYAGARAFGDFLLGSEAQEIIRTFGLEEFGQPLFVPDAGKSEDSLTR